MLIAVRHKTAYRYSSPVFLGPQVIRLKPRSDAAQRLEEFAITLDPTPATLNENIGAEGNYELLSWFQGQTETLEVETYCVVETLRHNPFEFIWLGESRLPLEYGQELAGSLLPYRFVEPLAATVQELASRIAVSVAEEAQPFPQALAGAIHSSCRQVFRLEGDPRSPEETLERRAGSCRDLTVLFNAIARSAGFAARFVSGYYAADNADRFELHAWSEVYLPGGGWRGFDPSSGLAVGDRYIAIASGPRPRDAAPLSGAFYGEADARLATTVDIQVLGSDAQQLELPT